MTCSGAALEEGEAAVVRIQSIRTVLAGDLLGSSPRHWDSRKRRPPFDWIAECMGLEQVVRNRVTLEECPAM